MQTIARPGTSHRTGNSSPTGPQGFALAASNTFEGFFRFPAEVRQFIPMDSGPTAYFRDVFVGGETFTDGANDGDTIRNYHRAGRNARAVFTFYIS